MDVTEITEKELTRLLVSNWQATAHRVVQDGSCSEKNWPTSKLDHIAYKQTYEKQLFEIFLTSKDPAVIRVINTEVMPDVAERYKRCGAALLEAHACDPQTITQAIRKHLEIEAYKNAATGRIRHGGKTASYDFQ